MCSAREVVCASSDDGVVGECAAVSSTCCVVRTLRTGVRTTCVARPSFIDYGLAAGESRDLLRFQSFAGSSHCTNCEPRIRDMHRQSIWL